MGQHVFDDSREESTQVDGPRAFVTGWPVWHSRSPLIHGAWLRDYALVGSYERVGVPPEEFGDFLADLPSSGYVGGNVTIPHKETAYAAVSRRDAAADAIGAVNTLWMEEGELVGGNTDAHGFSANLDERLPGWADAAEAVVLGAGGAARAVVFSLLSRGVAKVRLVNRTLSRAEAMASVFGARVSAHAQDETDALFQTADLVVNTVPVEALTAEEERMGMRPPLPDLSALRDHAMVTDIVYVPIETPILQAAALRGLRHADGLGMLLHQAVPGFERWFGVRPVVTTSLRQAIAADIARTG